MISLEFKLSKTDDFSLVFHDNQSSQYTSRAIQRRLESHGIARSMSRPGNPWDNALAESFFKTLKRELVNGKGYKTREGANQDVFKYVELYYNRQRMHSSIGYNATCDLERDIAWRSLFFRPRNLDQSTCWWCGFWTSLLE